jgi:hypothetical protein
MIILCQNIHHEHLCANNNALRILRKIRYFTPVLTLRECNLLTMNPMQILSSALRLDHQMGKMMSNPHANPMYRSGLWS